MTAHRNGVRHWLRRAVTVATGFVVGTVGLFGAWISGVDVPLVSGRAYVELVKLDRATTTGGPTGVVFILLIGSDFRPGVGGARGDALHVLALNPALGAGAMLNIPRDTCAAIPGHGTSKVNNAHAKGGPKLQAEAIAKMTGVPLEYAVSVDFAGFVSIVDGVGGVTVDVPFSMTDKDSGAYFEPGVQHLNGGQALAFSRDRHDFGPGDIQRTWNQGYLILSAMRELAAGYSSPSKRFELLASLSRHSQIHGAGLSDLFTLSQAAFAVDPAQVKSVTIPTSGGGCMDVAGSGAALFADFVDDGVLQNHAPGTPSNPTGR